jgi:hypothetical protein
MKSLLLWTLAIVLTLGLIGCTTGQIPDLSFLQGETPMSVIQGSVISGSTMKSLGSIPGLDSLPTQIEKTSVSETLSNLGLEIELITDEGELLQKGVFEKDSHSDQVPFRFQGHFNGGPLRLRIHQEGGSMDVALGTIENSGQVIELPPLEPEQAALATRYLEQSRGYRDLRRQTLGEFHETREEVFRLRIANLDDLETLKSTLDQVGVDSQGRLRRYSEDYTPQAHRLPQKRQPWERDLFSPLLPIPWMPSEPPLPSETIVIAPSPRPKVLQNQIQQVDLLKGSEQFTLYHKGGPGGVSPFEFPEESFKLQIHFSSDLSQETRQYLGVRASFQITQGQHRSRLNFSEFGPTFPSLRAIELTLEPDQLSINAYEDLVIYIHERLPSSGVGVVHQAFARIEFFGQSR